MFEVFTVSFPLQEAQLNRETLHGDVLLLAAIVTYLGPFRSHIRTELLSKWRQLCQTGSINLSPEDPTHVLLTKPDGALVETPPGFPIALSESPQLPLAQALAVPQDTSLRNMILKLLLWGLRRPWVQGWPLLADTNLLLDRSSPSCIISGKCCVEIWSII